MTDKALSPFWPRLTASLRHFAVLITLAIPLFLIMGRAVADIGMGIVSLTFLLSCLLERRWGWGKTPWFLLAIAAAVSMAISGMLSDYDRGDAILKAVSWLRFPVFAMAFATWILPHDRTQRFLAPSLILLLVLVAIDTVVQFVFGTSLTGHVKPDYPGRLNGPFQDLIVGIFTTKLAWPAIGFAFAWAFQVQDKKRLLVPLAFSGLLALTILISGERVAFAVFCIGGLFFLAGAKNLRGLLLGAGLGMAALVAGVILLTPALKERFVTITIPMVAHLQESPYANVWHNGLVAWKSAPVWGVGLGNFVHMCETVGAGAGFKNELPTMTGMHCVRHPHNPYLEWLAETGLVGLAFFIGLITLWSRDLLNGLAAAGQTLSAYYARLGCAAGMVVFLWPLMSSMRFFSNRSAILFWWVLGLALGLASGLALQSQQKVNIKEIAVIPS